MATYKVPQDVEADDKLIGPFSFRQFIYLIIVVAGCAVAWILSQVFIGLAIIPLPIILFFGALALPLRKDQPMEIYMAAIVSFYIKPRKRLWDPDGQQALIEIIAPKVVDGPQLKDFSNTEAEQRLSYLADIVDSRGWAVRGVQGPDNSSMTTDAYLEAQQVQDVLDVSNQTTQQIDNRLDQANARYRQELVTRMQQPAAQQSQPTPQPVSVVPNQTQQNPTPTQAAATPPTNDPSVTFNPYPTDIRQHVIQPIGNQPTPPSTQPTNNTAQAPSTSTPSTDIINLANNPDLSIETIAHEANRIKEKESLPKDEVVISLH